MTINHEVYKTFTEIPLKKRHKYFDKDRLLGKGANSRIYKVNTELTEERLVLKISNSEFCANEYNAFLFLRDKMLSGEIPHYFCFLYTSFTHNGRKRMILERCDQGFFDEVLIDYTFTLREFIQFFYYIADAVDYLEQNEMNHGDLWSENIMGVWNEELEEWETRIIDFDSAFKDGVCMKPSLGYADDYRKEFYIGYDLSRLFDDLKHSYTDYRNKREKEKKRMTHRILQQQKQGELLDIDPYQSDEEVREWDTNNIEYPREIIEFMFSLPCSDPEFPVQCPEMSGANVKKRLVELAETHGVPKPCSL